MAGIFALSFSNMDAKPYYPMTFESSFKYFLKWDKLYVTKKSWYSPIWYLLVTVFNFTLLFRFFLETFYASYCSSSLTVNSSPYWERCIKLNPRPGTWISSFEHNKVKYILREFKTRAVYCCGLKAMLIQTTYIVLINI